MSNRKPTIEHIDVPLETTLDTSKRPYDYAMQGFDEHKRVYEEKNRGMKLLFKGVSSLPGQPPTLRVTFEVVTVMGFAKRR